MPPNQHSSIEQSSYTYTIKHPPHSCDLVRNTDSKRVSSKYILMRKGTRIQKKEKRHDEIKNNIAAAVTWVLYNSQEDVPLQSNLAPNIQHMLSLPLTFVYAARTAKRRIKDSNTVPPKIKNEVAGGGLEVPLGISILLIVVNWYRHRIAECIRSRANTDLSTVLLTMALRYQNRKMMDQWDPRQAHRPRHGKANGRSRRVLFSG